MNTSVMVVDDDPEVLFTVKTILESAGLTVTDAADGAACLEELKKGFKGLILIDIMMPEMSGWEVVQAMIDAGYTEGNVTCILSAKSPDALFAKYSRHVREYIRKPFDPKALIETVKNHLAALA